MKKKLGVSEIVAAMMLLLITVAIGTALYLYLYSRAIAYQQSVTQELIAEEVRSEQQLTILLVYGNSTTNTIVLYLATGNMPVELDGIYVNNTLAYNSPTNLSASSISKVTVNSPIPLAPGEIVYVKIVYAGGYSYVEASGEVV